MCVEFCESLQFEQRDLTYVYVYYVKNTLLFMGFSVIRDIEGSI